jgi:hypothetical protein
MTGYDGYYGYDADVEGFVSNPENYTPGAIAFDWLNSRISPEMPTGRLMDASELLDEIFDLVNDTVKFTPSFVRLDGLTFKMLILLDAELRFLIREFYSLVGDYVYVPDPNQRKIAVVNLVFEYLRHRNPDRFV